MKRNLHDLAAAGALVLGLSLGLAVPARAQSNVTVYGLMDACVTSADLGSSRIRGINSGCSYGSRLGFRGTEDLGGALRAYFQLESGFNIDNGTLGQGGRIFGRKALLALGSEWGAVELGRDYAPAFYLVQPSDPLALGIGTASSSIWTGAATLTIARNDNVVNYLSPTWRNTSVRLQAGASEGGSARKVVGFNVLYRDARTIAGVAHGRVTNLTDTGDDAATTAAVWHDFGPVSLSAIYQAGSWKGTRTAAAPSSSSSIFSRHYRSYLVGGSVKVGAFSQINASYKRYDDRTPGNFDLTQISVHGVYSLSKRTDLYAGYSRARNERLSTYSVSDATTAYTGVSPGASTSLLAVGIKHVF